MANPEQALNWESVRHFLHAANASSLSGAARSLRVEHTTVGRQLSNLERAVGATLVERGPSGLALTALDQRVFELALEMDRAARAIIDVPGRERENVRLVVPTGLHRTTHAASRSLAQPAARRSTRNRQRSAARRSAQTRG